MMEKQEKSYEVLLQESKKMKKAITNTEINPSNIDPYLKTVFYLSNMNASFFDNFLQFMSHGQIAKIVDEYKFMIEDMTRKIKDLSLFSKGKSEENNDFSPNHFCKICSQNIQENNIKHVKNVLEHNPKKQFSQMLDQCMKLSEEKLFTDFQNSDFERKLYQNLSQKERILNMYSRQIQEFTSLIQSTISEFNSLKEIKATHSSRESEESRYVNMGKIGEDISKFLKSSFENRIPPWIHKMFGKMIQSYLASLKNKQCEEGVQTVDELQLDLGCKDGSKQNKMLKRLIKQLKDEFEEHLIYIEKLKSLIREKALGDLNEIKLPRMRNSNSMFVMISSMFKPKGKETSKEVSPELSKSRESDQSNDSWKNIRPKSKKKTGVILKEKKQKNEKKKRTSFEKNKIENLKGEKKQVKRKQSLNNKKELEKNNVSLFDISEGSEKFFQNKLSKTQNNTPNILKLENQLFLSENKKDEKYKTKENGKEQQEQQSQFLRSQKKIERKLANSVHIQKNMTKTQNEIHGNERRKEKSKKLISLHKNDQKSQQRESFHENYEKERKLVREVSEVLKKNRESKQISFPKLTELRPSQDKDVKKKFQILQETKNFNESQLPLKSIVKENQDPQKANKIQSTKKQQFFLRRDEKSLITAKEEKIYKILKKKLIIPDTISFSEFKSILKDEVESQPMNQTSNVFYNSAYSFLSSDIEQKGEKIQIEDEDFKLFLTKKIAFLYEESFSKNYHKRYLINLSKQQAQICSIIFSHMQAMKKISKKRYNKMCSLLRYPYQSLFCNFSTQTFTSEMNSSTFQLYFRKLISFHRACPLEKVKNICPHIFQFFKMNIQ